MSASKLTQTEIKNWDSLIQTNPDGGNVVQGSVIANLKSKQGWKTYFIKTSVCYVLILEKTIPTLGKLWYIPKGPGVKTLQQLDTALSEIKVLASEEKVFLIKIEPEIINNNESIVHLKHLGHKANDIQPNSNTIYMHVTPDTEQMITEINQKTRHAIRRARRDGLIVEQVEATDANCQVMLNLLVDTLGRRGVTLRSKEYYFDYWQSYDKLDQGKLFIAYDGDTPVAAAFVLIYGNKATYKDGGSLQTKTIYGASHALQWSIVEWLSIHKIKNYDLCGAPPISELQNTSHPHYGIGLFKTGFNKEVVEYVGVYDIVMNQSKYKIWRKFGEKLVHKYYRQALKQIFY